MNQEIIELAREAGIEDWLESCGEMRDVLDEHLRTFHDLAIAAEHARLLADSGEPTKYEFQGANGVWYPFLNDAHYRNTVEDGRWPIRGLYIAEQQAAAVLRERERCAQKCEELFSYGALDIADAIRGMQ